MEMTIRIEWEGPYNLEDIGYDYEKEKYNLNNEAVTINQKGLDHGVYQVYGCHPIYGDNVLLYIGKTEKQTFAKRLSDECWEYNSDFENIQFYVGRLFDRKEPSTKKWHKMIDLAERMLIYAHEPARNSSGILNISKNKNLLKEFEDIRVLNYASYRSLMPEISGELWIKNFDDYNGVFGESYEN